MIDDYRSLVIYTFLVALFFAFVGGFFIRVGQGQEYFRSSVLRHEIDCEACCNSLENSQNVDQCQTNCIFEGSVCRCCAVRNM